jgi:hypothetical protein
MRSQGNGIGSRRRDGKKMLKRRRGIWSNRGERKREAMEVKFEFLFHALTHTRKE